jgi:hypothetical protein
MERFKKGVKMIKNIIVIMGLVYAVSIIAAESNSTVNITVDAESLTVTANHLVNNARGYEEDASTAVVGESIVFSASERLVLRTNAEEYNEKISFTPLIDIKENNLSPYTFQLSSNYFDYSILKVRFFSSKESSSRDCEVLVLDNLLSKSQKNQLLDSLESQNVNYGIFENYLSIPCDKENNL